MRSASCFDFHFIGFGPAPRAIRSEAMTDPATGSSRPPIVSASVDLPEPLGPTMHVDAACGTDAEIARRTGDASPW